MQRHAGTPCATRPWNIVAGRDADSPTIMRVKKIPIEKTCAEFWNVEFIPEPTPRCSAGRLFITPARFGAAKAPIANPLSTRIDANTGYEKFTGMSNNSRNENDATTIPPVEKGREPYLSDRTPEMGPAIRNPAVSGSM